MHLDWLRLRQFKRMTEIRYKHCIGHYKIGKKIRAHLSDFEIKIFTDPQTDSLWKRRLDIERREIKS